MFQLGGGATTFQLPHSAPLQAHAGDLQQCCQKFPPHEGSCPLPQWTIKVRVTNKAPKRSFSRDGASKSVFSIEVVDDQVCSLIFLDCSCFSPFIVSCTCDGACKPAFVCCSRSLPLWLPEHPLCCCDMPARNDLGAQVVISEA